MYNVGGAPTPTPPIQNTCYRWRSFGDRSHLNITQIPRIKVVVFGVLTYPLYQLYLQPVLRPQRDPVTYSCPRYMIYFFI